MVYIHYLPLCRIFALIMSLNPSSQLRFAVPVLTPPPNHTRSHQSYAHLRLYAYNFYEGVCVCARLHEAKLGRNEKKQHNSILLGFSARCVCVCILFFATKPIAIDNFFCCPLWCVYGLSMSRHSYVYEYMVVFLSISSLLFSASSSALARARECAAVVGTPVVGGGMVAMVFLFIFSF